MYQGPFKIRDIFIGATIVVLYVAGMLAAIGLLKLHVAPVF